MKLQERILSDYNTYAFLSQQSKELVTNLMGDTPNHIADRPTPYKVVGMVFLSLFFPIKKKTPRNTTWI